MIHIPFNIKKDVKIKFKDKETGLTYKGVVVMVGDSKYLIKLEDGRYISIDTEPLEACVTIDRDDDDSSGGNYFWGGF